jgi:hypothetical protein
MPRITTAKGGEKLAAWLHDGGGTKEEACAELNMTGAQFNRFLARVRDVVATATSEPVAYDPVTYEYSFAGENGEAAAYALHRQKIARKQLIRLRSGTVVPAMAKFSTAADLSAQRYARYLDNTIAELSELIALTEANGQQ